MRFFWKIVLTGALSLGGYWLYKKSSRPGELEIQSGPRNENRATSQSSAGRDKNQNEQVIERLTAIEGVTSRVAKNLVERGIKSKEALMKLSEEELRSVKGIGPKRAAKILNL